MASVRTTHKKDRRNKEYIEVAMRGVPRRNAQKVAICLCGLAVTALAVLTFTHLRGNLPGQIATISATCLTVLTGNLICIQLKEGVHKKRIYPSPTGVGELSWTEGEREQLWVSHVERAHTEYQHLADAENEVRGSDVDRAFDNSRTAERVLQTVVGVDTDPPTIAETDEQLAAALSETSPKEPEKEEPPPEPEPPRNRWEMIE